VSGWHHGLPGVDRLFLDANVLFTAAHNPVGKAASLFDRLSDGYWALLSSSLAVEEARRNIQAKYPLCQPRLQNLNHSLQMVPQPEPRQPLIALPDKDVPIFLAAQAAGATHLLTGDLQHFGRHMNNRGKSGGIVIQTVAMYLESSTWQGM
jgi:uncharacterized protein